MEIGLVFFIVGLLLFLGFLAELLFRKTNIPDVLLLIFIGMILSSFLGESIHSSIFTELFITFALIFILFQGALRMDFAKLLESMSSSLLLTLLNFLASVFIITFVLLIFNFPFQLALLVGSIIGGTSAIVTIPILKNIALREKYSSSLVIESAFSDVLCIVGALAILSFIQTGSIAAGSFFQTIVISIILGVGSGVFIGISWSLVVSKFKSLSQAYIVTIGVLLILYGVVQAPFVGGNGALACLSFGLVIGNSKKILGFFKHNSHDEAPHAILTQTGQTFFSEISFLLKVIFFVYLGMLLDFSNISIVALAGILTLVLFLIRPMIVYLAFARSKLNQLDRTILEVMVPKGLAAAVLAQLIAIQLVEVPVLGDISSLLSSLVLSVVFFSILLTSILVFLTEKKLFFGFYSFVPFLFKKSSSKEDK